MLARRQAIVVLALALAAAVACERERRRFPDDPSARAPARPVPLTAFGAGGSVDTGPVRSPYQDNAYGISEGKRLYSAFNCNGCHAEGGGAIGPALMDDKWIYGPQPDQVFATIVQGRPNGMPSFGGRVTDDQVWQLVAYVQSLGALTPRDAASGRDDDQSVRRPDLRLERVAPRQTGHR